jgi:hypothetical protein
MEKHNAKSGPEPRIFQGSITSHINTFACTGLSRCGFKGVAKSLINRLAFYENRANADDKAIEKGPPLAALFQNR